jgi:hypothetical protein
MSAPKLSQLELDPAELAALERQPRKPPSKKARKHDAGKPRDELGRFTRIETKAA